MTWRSILVVALASLCTPPAWGQFPQNSNSSPFLNNNNLDNNNQQNTFRDRERDPFGNPFSNPNQNNNNNGNPFLQQQPQPLPPSRDRDPFNNNNFDGSFNSFPPPLPPPRGDPFNPFNTRRDFGNPFASPPRFDTSDSSYFSGVETEKQCPQGWHLFPPNQSPQQACYKFVLSPTHSRNEAQRNCLVSCVIYVTVTGI